MDLDQKSVIKYAVIAGVGYLAYWYVTNHGPNGAVTAGSVSYWDTWFGNTAAVPVTSQPAVTTTQTTTSQQPANYTGANTSTTTTPIQAPANTIKGKIQAATAGNAFVVNGMGSADIWNYFYPQFATPLTEDQFHAAFMVNSDGSVNDRNNMPPMTLDQFLSRIQSIGIGLNGLGEIVEAPTVQSLPLRSSTFNRSPGLQGLRPNRGGGMQIH